MKRSIKRWHIIVVGLAAILLFGLKEDVDYCTYTSEQTRRIEFFGLALKSETHPGFRPWIEDDLGLTIASKFEGYSDTFPLFTPVSSGPGNWLFLRSAESLYRKNPESRVEIKKLVKALTLKDPPLVEPADYEALNFIRDPAWNKIAESGRNGD